MRSFHTPAEGIRTWLDAHFDAEGCSTIDPNQPALYYKAPYLLAMAGLWSKGARAAGQALARFVDADGNLKVASPVPLENRVYGMGWLALGAVAVESYDLSEILVERLTALLDPQSGGMVLPDEDAGEDLGEVCFSGGVGMALAAAGRFDPAQRLADRFLAMLEAQPEEGRFYNRFRRDGSVYPQAAAGAWEKMYDLERDEQRPANFATVINTLVWVGRARRDPAYFAGARRYADLVYGHRQDPAQFGRATKFGWSLLNLYEVTGDEDLVERARHLGEVLVGHQEGDGLWAPRPAGDAEVSAWDRLSYSSDCAMTVLSLARFAEE